MDSYEKETLYILYIYILLLRTANDILLGLDKRHVSLLTLLDLSSAFDTIDHNILLNRLNYLYRISGTCLSWFRL